MKKFLALVILLAGCSAHEPARELPGGSDDKPDIVMISIDTLRPDHLGSYGYDRDTSPFLDARAREGVVFTSAWSPAPWTLPAHVTMFTALRPDQHGALDEDLTIRSDAAFFTEALEAVGYRRGGFVTAPFVGTRYGFDRGFDHFEELFPADFSLTTALDADAVTSRALDWAADLPGGEPAFAFLHLYDVHYPCEAPAPFNTQFNRAAHPDELHYENYFYYLQHPLTAERLVQEIGQYDEEIAWVDATLREFCTTWLKSRPNTVFVVVSDHGEEFGERGSWGHGHTLTPEQLHVPWIVWGAGILPARINTRVGLEDLAPTLASLAGTSFGPYAGIDRSAALKGGEAGPPGAALASTSRRNTLKIRLHQPPHDMIADLRARTVQVYDLDADPQATNNLGPGHNDLVVGLWGAMLQRIGLPWTALEPVELSTDGVVITNDGRLFTGELNLDAGIHFALWPLDATLRGNQAGPWRVVGGDLPEPGSALSYEGARIGAQSLELSDEERERLRSLGYTN